MASYDGKYVLNIVPLFNTGSPDGNDNSTEALTNAIAAIQTMVNTSNYSIYTNSIYNFNTAPIEIESDVNVNGKFTISNLPILDYITNGQAFQVSTANLTISTGAIGLFLLSSPVLNNEVGGFQLYASTVFSIDSNNNFVFQPYGISNISSIVRISSLNLVVDYGDFSSLNVGNLSVYNSTILASLFVNSHSQFSSLNVSGNAFIKTFSTNIGSFGNIRTSTLEVSQPINYLTVSTLFSSTSTTGLLKLSDNITSAQQNLYAASNILYYNGSPIGGTLSYAYEQFSF